MLSDLKFAVRLLAQQRGFTAAVVLTLGLGIGAATAAYSLVDAVLLKPLPYPESDRIVSLTIRGRGADVGVSGGVLDAAAKLPSIEAVAGSLMSEQNLVSGNELVIVYGAVVTSGFFDVFKAPALFGRTLSAAPANHDEIVLAERLWRHRFAADSQIVGRAIRLDDRLYSVVGVMPDGFSYPENVSYWRSYEIPGQQRAQIGPGPFRSVARLRDSGLAAARSETAALSGSLQVTIDREPAMISLTPFLEELTGIYRRTLIYLAAAVGLVLLIACGNATHLVLARTLGRAQELTVRRAIGAAPGQILRQLVVESSVLALASGVAGVAIAWLMIRVIPSVTMPDLPRLTEVTLDLRVLAFAMATCSTTVLFVGLWPAWMSRGSMLISRSATPRTARRAASIIVTGEIALTLSLVICGGLATTTLMRRLSVDVGFDPQSLSLVALRPSTAKYSGIARSDYFERVTDAVRRAPGVDALAATSHVPLAPLLAANAQVSSDSEDQGRPLSVGARARTIGPGSLAALRVSILSGREFTSGDRAGAENVAMVNRSLATRLWRDADPVGKVVRAPVFTAAGIEQYRIIGVVGDIRGSLLRPPQPEIYISALQRPPRTMHLMVRSRLGPAAVDAIVRDAIGAIDPEQPPVTAVPMQMLFREATAYNRFSALWLAGFASLATALAISGILASVMRAVVTRTRELGIRAAVGATPSEQVCLVVRDLWVPIAIGSSLGVAASYNFSVVALRAMAIEQFDATIAAIAVITVACVTGIAGWIPARRAARIDPVRALQAE